MKGATDPAYDNLRAWIEPLPRNGKVIRTALLHRELATEAQADEWFGILPKHGQWENTGLWDHRARIITLPREAES